MDVNAMTSIALLRSPQFDAPKQRCRLGRHRAADTRPSSEGFVEFAINSLR